ncbi:lymphotactin-like [Suricata suricatta]|uniref:lymphotactin-like n=1 Tax=Suricata suricatta TaxID=37032 RepID=UPI001155E396|nr:lymphotactin-like [Suricata suricatta]
MRPLFLALLGICVLAEFMVEDYRFITRRGLKVCADPQAKWVKKAVESVDKSTRRNMKQTTPTGAQQFTNSAVTLTT